MSWLSFQALSSLARVTGIHTLRILDSVFGFFSTSRVLDLPLTTAGKVKNMSFFPTQLLMYQAQLMAQLPIEDPVAYTELVCKLMK